MSTQEYVIHLNLLRRRFYGCQYTDEIYKASYVNKIYWK